MRLENIDIRTHTSHSKFRSWSMPRMVLVGRYYGTSFFQGVAITLIGEGSVYSYIHLVPIGNQFLFNSNSNYQFENNLLGKHGDINIPSPIYFLATALAMFYYLLALYS